MDNTELFLDKYKELENAAINEFKLPPDGSAVAKLEKRSEFLKSSCQLLQFFSLQI